MNSRGLNPGWLCAGQAPYPLSFCSGPWILSVCLFCFQCELSLQLLHCGAFVFGQRMCRRSLEVRWEVGLQDTIRLLLRAPAWGRGHDPHFTEPGSPPGMEVGEGEGQQVLLPLLLLEPQL